MLNQIKKTLEASPGLMAKDLAKKLGTVKKKINPLLYEHTELFRQDSSYCWYVINSNLLDIEFNTGWMDCNGFEKTLKQSGSPLDSNCQNISFIIPQSCHILLESLTRFLALCNQLISSRKSVSIKFADTETFSYLKRVGFFDCLHNAVVVYPKRPNTSSYKGNSHAVVEFGEIDSDSPNNQLPRQLKDSFVTHAGSAYAQPIFTVLSELFGNVTEHSETKIAGFTALQVYKNCKKPHIQTVISDSGIGIIGTLRPILEKKYPKLAEKFDLSKPEANALLVLEVFKKGSISQHGKKNGRGLGIKRSSDVAAKFNAKVSIRQENFELNLIYQNSDLYHFFYKVNMPSLKGTHICFDFLLD